MFESSYFKIATVFSLKLRLGSILGQLKSVQQDTLTREENFVWEYSITGAVELGKYFFRSSDLRIWAKLEFAHGLCIFKPFLLWHDSIWWQFWSVLNVFKTFFFLFHFFSLIEKLAKKLFSEAMTLDFESNWNLHTHAPTVCMHFLKPFILWYALKKCGIFACVWILDVVWYQIILYANWDIFLLTG